MTCNGLTSDESKRGIGESTPKVDGISHNYNSPKAPNFGNSIVHVSLGNDKLIT